MPPLKLPVKFSIAHRIRELQNDAGSAYVTGWSDARIASEFGVSRQSVAIVRKQMYPEMVSRQSAGESAAEFRELVEKQLGSLVEQVREIPVLRAEIQRLSNLVG